MEPGWSVVIFCAFIGFTTKSASAYFWDVLQLAARHPPPTSVLGQGPLWVSQFPSSPSTYPVPPDSVNSPGAPLCVQTPQGLGDQLKYIARKY